MHIVRVVGKLEPGGAQLALLRLTRELRHSHGIRTTLLVGDATREGMALAHRYGADALAFRTHRNLHPNQNLQWLQSAAFARWLSDGINGADLVHAHMVGAWWAVGQVIDARTPFVATEHNEVNWSPRRVRSLREVGSRIDRFYAMGPAASQFALDAGVRPHVIQPSRSSIEGLTGRSRCGLPTPRLTFAGRLAADKGADVLVEAISMLAPNNVFAYLLGSGPLLEPLAARVRELSLDDRVCLPGWVDRPWSYIAGSSVHVVPSREEAWSQSAVLALGLGVPVIGTRVDGLTNTLSESRGVLVAPNDPVALSGAIRDVLAGRSTVDREAAMKYAHQFTTAKVADCYAEHYQMLIATASQDARHKAARQPTAGTAVSRSRGSGSLVR